MQMASFLYIEFNCEMMFNISNHISFFVSKQQSIRPVTAFQAIRKVLFFFNQTQKMVAVETLTA